MATTTSYSTASFRISSQKCNPNNQRKMTSYFGFQRERTITRICALASNSPVPDQPKSSFPRRVHQRRSSLESLFCYDKPIPEERIGEPVGLSLAEKKIGNNLPCPECHAKGAVLCTTCSGTGLYVDSILESQGIVIKVRCLGCGGSGNIMCSECGGRGHVGQ